MRIAWRDFRGALYRIELDANGSVVSASKFVKGVSTEASAAEVKAALRLGEVNELAEAFTAARLKAESAGDNKACSSSSKNPSSSR